MKTTNSRRQNNDRKESQVRTRTRASNDNAHRLDEFDELVRLASRGDSRAVGAIAIAFGPTLLAVARDTLGPCREEEDLEVLESFLSSLVEGERRFSPVDGRAIPWMGGVIRAIARDRLESRENEWDPGEGGWFIDRDES